MRAAVTRAQVGLVLNDDLSRLLKGEVHPPLPVPGLPRAVHPSLTARWPAGYQVDDDDADYDYDAFIDRYYEEEGEEGWGEEGEEEQEDEEGEEEEQEDEEGGEVDEGEEEEGDEGEEEEQPRVAGGKRQPADASRAGREAKRSRH